MKIKVNGDYFIDFNDFTVSKTLDSVASVFAFTSNFNPEIERHKSFFKPLSFHSVEFFNDEGDLFLTGVILTNKFSSSEKKQMVALSGYSKSGILEDCTLPYSDYPLEHSGMNLKQITERMIRRFGIKLIVDSSVSQIASVPYVKSTAEPDESVKSYISKLASQKNVVLSHNEKGDIILFKPSKDSNPKYFYNQENCLEMTLDVNGQALHSDLSAIRQPSKEDSDLTSVDSVKNHLVKQYRPIVKKMTSGSETDTQPGAKNMLGDELKAIQVKVTLNRWDILDCGDIVEVENPEIYIYSRQRFMVSSYNISESSKGRKMDINLVLPETFSHGEPKKIFD